MAKPVTRGRTYARVAAVQALFQADQAGDQIDVVIDQFMGSPSFGYDILCPLCHAFDHSSIIRCAHHQQMRRGALDQWRVGDRRVFGAQTSGSTSTPR